ncbi:MAG: FIST C-terminal domain-containing protein [Deltaproteobacteria bacterium]|nr:FIST C-terminal domain-containing protein [Deltaproteobacteria bacterium]
MLRATCGLGASSHGPTAVDLALAAAAGLPRRPDIAFLYVSDHLAGAAEAIRARVVERTGVRALGGTVGMAVAAGRSELSDAPGVALLLVSAPGAGVRELRLDARAPGASLVRDSVAIVHADPLHAHAATAEDGALGTAFRVGGLTSTRTSSAQFDSSGSVASGCTALVLDHGFSPRVATAQGVEGLGPLRRVTRAVRNIVVTLDGRPALNVLLEDLGVAPGTPTLDDDEVRRMAEGALVAVGLARRDHEAFLVRGLLGYDPERGALAIDHEPEPDGTLRFVRRSAAAARDDLRAQLDRLVEGSRRPPAAALYFSCVARGQALFGRPGVELDLIADALDDVPLAGFFGQGEVAGGEVHSHAGVLVLLG